MWDGVSYHRVPMRLGLIHWSIKDSNLRWLLSLYGRIWWKKGRNGSFTVKVILNYMAAAIWWWYRKYGEGIVKGYGSIWYSSWYYDVFCICEKWAVWCFRWHVSKGAILPMLLLRKYLLVSVYCKYSGPIGTLSKPAPSAARIHHRQLRRSAIRCRATPALVADRRRRQPADAARWAAATAERAP